IAWRAAAVGLGATALMFTHYFAAGACLAIGAFAVLCLRGKARWLTLGSLVIAGMFFAILWWPTLRRQLDCVPQTADIFLSDDRPGHVLRTLARLAAMPMTLLADARDQTSPPRIVLGLALLSAVVAAVARHRREAALWVMWLGGVLGAVAALDLARQTLHLTFVRYVLLASPALCILLALPARRRWGSLIPALAIALELIALSGGTAQHTPDLRPMLRYLSEHARPGDVLVLPSRHPLGRDGQVLYLYIAYYTDLLPTGIIVPTHPLDMPA